jgi:hypothetical protein
MLGLFIMMIESLLVLVGQKTVTPFIFWGLLLMVIIGSIIIWVVGTLIFFLPAAVVAGVIWLLTGNPNYTGAAFLLIAILSILKK